MNQDPKVKEARRYIDHELIAEIFGFVPSEVTDDIYNLANIVFYRFMEGIAQRLIELRPDKQRAINSASNSYENAVEKTIDQLFNAFQQYVSQHVWEVPRDLNIQHKHHEGLDFTVTQSEIDDIDEQIEKIRKNIIAQKKLNAVLLQMERNRLAEIKQLDKQLEKLSFLNDIAREENVQDIDELLKVIKEGIEQEKKEAIRQLTHQYDPTKLEKEHVKESRSIIDKDLERLFKRPE